MLGPFAHSAAMSMAMPARMSGLLMWIACSRDGPATRTRCGSHCTMCAPISIRRSTKYMRLSNIFSKNSTLPRACVARTIAIVRSDGNAGQGRPRSSGIVAASFLIRRDCSAGTTRSSPSTRSVRHRVVRNSSGWSAVRDTARRGEGRRVTAARPISEPTSMWSGPMRCVAPRSRRRR